MEGLVEVGLEVAVYQHYYSVDCLVGVLQRLDQVAFRSCLSLVALAAVAAFGAVVEDSLQVDSAGRAEGRDLVFEVGRTDTHLG